MIPEYVYPKAQRMYDFAILLGYSHAAAIGVLANVMAESAFDEHAVEAGGGGGYGLGQWTPQSNLYAQGALLGYTAAQCETFDVQTDILLRGDETGQWLTGAYLYDPLVIVPLTLSAYKLLSDNDTATMNYMAHWERPHEDPEVNHKERRKQYAALFETYITGSGGGLKPHLPVLEGTPLTDTFGWRYNPVTGVYEFHNGDDYAGALNDPIFATMSGVVEQVGFEDEFRGNWILIRHTGDAYYSKYLHLNSVNVTVGQSVSWGQTIGAMGTTGQSTGVHLHFTITTTPEGELDGGLYIDPQWYLAQGGVIPPVDQGDDLIILLLTDALNGWRG